MTTDTYYDRSSAVHLDGSPIFKTEADSRSEGEVAAHLEAMWKCSLHSWGELTALDWYATRYGRLVGIVELKTRSHASDKYATVFLNMRKWFALQLASTGLGIPGIFVVRFTDAILWIPLDGIDATRHEIAGTRRIVKSTTDIEPVIHVRVADMAPVEERQ